ncbi:hypothetical protein [Allocoleopsis franciscana]|uniref:hypothetical protein n=1 Tax=Allocoleopsis franciscana TaxID=2886352 RepID=UPI0012DD6CAB|nr:hypothetical protein [Allocoleopsis franciscana]
MTHQSLTKKSTERVGALPGFASSIGSFYIIQLVQRLFYRWTQKSPVMQRGFSLISSSLAFTWS